MGSNIYVIDTQSKQLRVLPKRGMADLGFTEPRDLETWLASMGEDLFERRILWLARQDPPSTEQRSDLIGIDEDGDLLVAELKRGEVEQGAITQALAYAAIYAGKSQQDLAAMLAQRADQLGAQVGRDRAQLSEEDALAAIVEHVREDAPINGAQILMLVGESFAPSAIEICEYLNGAGLSQKQRFSIECWRYTVFESAAGAFLLLLEQVLPALSANQLAAQGREAYKAERWKRDEVRMRFIRELRSFLDGLGGKVSTSGERGWSYGCYISRSDWGADQKLEFYVGGTHPELKLPRGAELASEVGTQGLRVTRSENGRLSVSLDTVECGTARFSTKLGEEVMGLVLGGTLVSGPG